MIESINRACRARGYTPPRTLTPEKPFVQNCNKQLRSILMLRFQTIVLEQIFKRPTQRAITTLCYGFCCGRRYCCCYYLSWRRYLSPEEGEFYDKENQNPDGTS